MNELLDTCIKTFSFFYGTNILFPVALSAGFVMAKRTKKVGITGKYGTQYGASLRKKVKKI